MRSGECCRQRIFDCPLNCEVSGDEITSKMTYRQLQDHLWSDCPLVKLECQHCGVSEARGKMKKHASKICVRNLLDKKKETLARVKDLKKRKKQLLIGLINGENTRDEMTLEEVYSALAEQTGVFDQREPEYDYQSIGFEDY